MSISIKYKKLITIGRKIDDQFEQMLPDILNIIYKFVGPTEFTSLDAYENVLREYHMLYCPEVLEFLRMSVRNQ